MQEQDVTYYFAELDLALQNLGIQTQISLLLLGGAYMLITVNVRRATNDIDVFPFVGSELDQVTGIPLAVALYQAASTVAQKNQLHPHWLNTLCAGSLQPTGVTPRRTLWRTYQVLKIYLPEQEYVLVQKLLIHRPKDQQDIVALFQALGIATRAQAQALLDRYVPQEEQHRQMVPVLLRSYFPS
jgi:hypothetical protein